MIRPSQAGGGLINLCGGVARPVTMAGACGGMRYDWALTSVASITGTSISATAWLAVASAFSRYIAGAGRMAAASSAALLAAGMAAA